MLSSSLACLESTLGQSGKRKEKKIVEVSFSIFESQECTHLLQCSRLSDGFFPLSLRCLCPPPPRSLSPISVQLYNWGWPYGRTGREKREREETKPKTCHNSPDTVWFAGTFLLQFCCSWYSSATGTALRLNLGDKRWGGKKKLNTILVVLQVLTLLFNLNYCLLF